MRTLLVSLFLVFSAALATAQDLGGYTHMTASPAHGTQVEYVTTDGKTFLWYPGNSVILEGRWKQEGSQICFAYGENTYNPATGHQGGGWECTGLRGYVSGITERMQGDVLRLQGRTRAPFELSKQQTNLTDLIARVRG